MSILQICGSRFTPLRDTFNTQLTNVADSTWLIGKVSHLKMMKSLLKQQYFTINRLTSYILQIIYKW